MHDWTVTVYVTPRRSTCQPAAALASASPSRAWSFAGAVVVSSAS
jgi:hypothetical protein